MRSAREGLGKWGGLCCSLLCSTSAFSVRAVEATGATVDESKVVHTYYVDPAGADAADDDQHGTQDSPFVTLRRALDAALRDKDANIGAKVIIAAGVYRETIDIPAPTHADTDAPLVIEAAERGQTAIDAADAAGWEAGTWSKTAKESWTHPWPFGGTAHTPTPHGGSPHNRSAPAPAADNAGAPLVFFNGLALRQEASAPGPTAPGTFVVGHAPKTGSATLLVWRQDADDDLPDNNQFQVGVRDHAMLVTGRRNVVVRGLVLQHAANPMGAPLAGLVFVGCSHVLVEDVLSQWNDGAGLLLKGSTAAPWSEGFTLRRVQLIHNGQSGLAAENLKNVLAEDCETSFNDFRGEWAGILDPQAPAAGLKVHGLHGSTWRRQRAVANFARGLWWSSDCTDLFVEDSVVRDNLLGGIFVENCPGPTVVHGSLIAGNKIVAGTKPEAAQPAAVSVEASPDVTLENNVIAGNAMPQLGLRNVAERTDGTNFETGAKTVLRAERHAYRHNAVWVADADQPLVDLPVSDATGKSDFAFYYGTLDSDENCFWNPAATEVFCTYDRTSYHRTGLSLAGWRTFLATRASAGSAHQPEAGSLWQDPQFMEPEEGDYRLQARSPLTDWGLPAEEGGAAQ